MRRAARIFGTLLVLAGIATLAWVLAVWKWQDPFTAFYTRWEQRGLAASYSKRIETFRVTEPPRRAITIAASRKRVSRDARRYRKSSRRGEAIARIRVPRLGLDMIVINGTDP